MSVVLRVILDPSRMPSTQVEWDAAIHSFGFEAKLDTEFDPVSFAGFLPCVYRGKEAGFAYYRGSACDDSRLLRLRIPTSKPSCIKFSTGANYSALASSMICAAILACIADGVLIEEDGTTIVPQGTEIDWARNGEKSLQADIDSQDAPATPDTRRPWWRFW